MVKLEGKAMMYVQLKKALYGTLQSAILFWKLLSSTLQEWGFKINDYDRCIAKKTINGTQCTIIWYVNDLKITHAEKAVVENILQKLTDKSGKDSPLTTTRDKELISWDVNRLQTERKSTLLYERIH